MPLSVADHAHFEKQPTEAIGHPMIRHEGPQIVTSMIKIVELKVVFRASLILHGEKKTSCLSKGRSQASFFNYVKIKICLQKRKDKAIEFN